MATALTHRRSCRIIFFVLGYSGMQRNVEIGSFCSWTLGTKAKSGAGLSNRLQISSWRLNSIAIERVGTVAHRGFDRSYSPDKSPQLWDELVCTCRSRVQWDDKLGGSCSALRHLEHRQCLLHCSGHAVQIFVSNKCLGRFQIYCCEACNGGVAHT